MKILYLECTMGASGDMLLGALTDLLPQPDAFITRLNELGLPGVNVTTTDTQTGGLRARHVSVNIAGKPADDPSCHGAAESLPSIENIIATLPLPEPVRQHTREVYSLLATAESAVHAQPVELVHFHELGALDALIDIAGVSLALSLLDPDQIIASPPATGWGQVRCAHGLLPVPTPATAELLRGIPCVTGTTEGELLTPTGAALLRHYANYFGQRPPMTITQIGCGSGCRLTTQPNCVRAFWGKTVNEESGAPNGTITQLNCNIDDMTGEDIGFAIESLYAAGALEVFTVPIQMKKQRPGIWMICICREQDGDRLAALLLRHTTSFGVRRNELHRYTLTRHTTMEETPHGAIRIKHGQGYGITKSKPEYDDLRRIALEQELSLLDLRNMLKS